MRLTCRVQHHPSRSDLLPPLLEALNPLPTEVIPHSSDPPSPWGGYLKCLTDLPDCSHLLIVQDDARPCANFAETLQAVVSENPDLPICLFLARLPRRWSVQATNAMKYGTRYIRLRPSSNEFFPVVAVVWPVEIARALAEWPGTAHVFGPRPSRSDDGVTAKFLLKMKQDVIVTVPSLVEHPDMVPSVKGRNNTAWGKDAGRVAAFWYEDVSGYEWSTSASLI